MLLSATTQADPISDCNNIIDACNSALQAKQKTIDLYSQALTDSQQSVYALQVKLEDLQASKDAWYNNTIVWGAVGFVLGGIAFTYLKK